MKLIATSGQRILKGLFLEMNYGYSGDCPFTLKRYDHNQYKSLYKLYMEADDPTEYNFALSVFNDWEHWTMLCDCTWFKEYITSWRTELEVRTKARALLAIRAIAADSSAKEHYQASKYVLTSGWKDRPAGRGAGRPSKEDIKKEATRLAQSSKDIDEDFDRIGLNS